VISSHVTRATAAHAAVVKGGQILLTAQSTGQDFFAAAQVQRDIWGMKVAATQAPGDLGRSALNGTQIAECLLAALTKRGDADDAGAVALRNNGLSMLSAFCAMRLSESAPHRTRRP